MKTFLTVLMMAAVTLTAAACGERTTAYHGTPYDTAGVRGETRTAGAGVAVYDTRTVKSAEPVFTKTNSK